MITAIKYDSNHEMFRGYIEKFIEKEVTPNYEQWEEDGMVDRDIWRKMGELGMLCPHIDSAYGGMEDYSYNIVVTEALCKGHATSLAVGMAIHSDIVATYIDKYGTGDQKAKYLPGMVSGEIVAALGMTEPGAGSDLGAITTKGQYPRTKMKEGSPPRNLKIDGQKVFITNGYHADIILTAVRTEGEGYGGVSLVIIETDSDGVSVNLLKKIGLKSQDTCEVFFDGVKVPETNILGAPGHGFFMMMDELPRERLALSIGAVASSRQILDDTIEYVKQREAFGRPISKFQNTQFEIADIDSSLTSAEAFTRYCTELILEGELDTVTASKLKVVTTDLQCDLVDRCLQLHGGYGYMSEYPVARAFCDGRIQRIYGGTNEIMKVMISRDIFK